MAETADYTIKWHELYNGIYEIKTENRVVMQYGLILFYPISKPSFNTSHGSC